MKDNTLEDLNEVVSDHIKKVVSLPDGSEEKAKAIEELGEIHKLKVEEAKLLITRVGQVLEVSGKLFLAVGGWVFYKSVLKDEHYFEINNSPRTQTFKNLLSRIFPKF